MCINIEVWKEIDMFVVLLPLDIAIEGYASLFVLWKVEHIFAVEDEQN